MKTKTYKFEVTIEVEEPKGGFLQKLKDELSREAEELKICKEINKQSEEMHAKMLMDFVSEIKDEIGEVISSIERDKSSREINGYRTNSATIKLRSGFTIFLYAMPKVSKIDGIRYTTYADGINLQYKTNTQLESSHIQMDAGKFLGRFKNEIKHAIK